VQLRFATGGAAEGWAEVVTAASPYLVCTEQSVLHDFEHGPAALARYALVEDREVRGVVRARAGAAGAVRVMLQVHPDHRGRGYGRALLDRVGPVAPAASLTGIVNGDARSRAVAEHWGFALQREHRISAVDPRQARRPDPPPGFRVAPLADVSPEQVWRCHDAAAGDDPSGLSAGVPFEEFVEARWRDPLHRLDLGHAVLDGDRVVAFTQVQAAGGRAWNGMTACLAPYRRRGLATTAKAHALAAMAAAGITRCCTANDDANAAMRAVNDRLGYRPFATTWSAGRPATPA
jgi:GNAT superfamily N-acetyltransferase